jgi:2-dehydro-3-deoxyphosphogluconate aldolase/(4S)-4-hydroxy-2-oxoglutarate aldolase
MTRLEVGAQIRKIGIIPAVRVFTAQDVMFAAFELAHAGIPIVEVAVVEPGALAAIAALSRRGDDVIVGAGEVMDLATARRCLDAGARFITGPGLNLEVVEVAHQADVVVFPGALTPTEVLRAWQAGSDFVKIFPCSVVGGARYLQALQSPFPDVPLIASGGVNQDTAGDFIRAGATALGIGGALVPHESIHLRQPHRIRELTRRFLGIVNTAREEIAPLKAPGKASQAPPKE